MVETSVGGRVVSSAVFASVSETSMVKSGVMVVEAEVKRVVELAPEFMEIVELEAVDSCHVDATAGASDVVTDADAVVVETAPAPAPLTVAELVVDATRAVVAAIEDRVSGILVVASDPLVAVVGP